MLRVAITEEDAEQRELLAAWLTRYGEEQELELELTLFSTTQELTAHYRPVFDLLLLEVCPPEMDGLGAARAIRTMDRQVVILLLSRQMQYAVDGYEVGALDYLLYPIRYEVLASRLSRAVQQVELTARNAVTLFHTGGVTRLRTQDIYYVEIQDHMLHYHTADGEYVRRGTMQGAEEELKPCGFAKCNHWYLVNLLYVREIRKNLVMVRQVPLEISRRSRAAFLEALKSYPELSVPATEIAEKETAEGENKRKT